MSPCPSRYEMNAMWDHEKKKIPLDYFIIQSQSVGFILLTIEHCVPKLWIKQVTKNIFGD